MSQPTPRQPQQKSRWYVQQSGQLHGPFSASRLRKLAAAGRLLRGSQVAKSSDGPWYLASRVKGLFPRSSEDSPRPGTQPLPTVEFPTRPDCDTVWFYRKAGVFDEEANGPHTIQEMDDLIKQGKVRASTLVLKRGDNEWETAFSAGLFMDAPAPRCETTGGQKQQAAQSIGEPAADDSPAPQCPSSEKEEVLWSGKPSHHINYGLYAACVLTAPLILPAIWGIKKFRERDCLRYQITSKRIRIKCLRGSSLRRDIPIEEIHDAAMVTPLALQATDLCNIELYGKRSLTNWFRRKTLAVLEGVPLQESALVISFCEAAVHRHIPLRMKQRRQRDEHVQEMELARRAALRSPGQSTGNETETDDLPELTAAIEAANRHWERVRWEPPKTASALPRPGSASSGDGFLSWILGPDKKKRTVWVKGHWRGKTWVRRHRRTIYS